MTRIYVPSSGPLSWKSLLAKPDRHWAVGYSARTLANSWEAAEGLPPEIERLLAPLLKEVQLLVALPEHKVPLPGGRRESQSDVFALLRTGSDVVACTIEGKVDEPFGPTLGEWLVDASAGKLERLAFLQKILGLHEEIPRNVRYQLLHRTASAVMESDRFATSAAAMIVHSFSPAAQWFEDFRAFAALFGAQASPDRAVEVRLPSGKPLYLGWATGEARFRML